MLLLLPQGLYSVAVGIEEAKAEKKIKCGTLPSLKRKLGHTLRRYNFLFFYIWQRELLLLAESAGWLPLLLLTAALLLMAKKRREESEKKEMF
jgi:hypothetical protein